MPTFEDPSLGNRPSPVRRVARRLSRTVPVERVPFLQGQAIALACTLIASLLRLGLDPVLTGAPYVTFFPAVLIASIWGGTRAGLTTLILTWSITFFVFLEPSFAQGFDRTAIWTAASFALFGGLLLLVAAMLHDLVLALRRSEEHARVLASEMEHRIENLVATATALARQTARSATSTEQHVRLFEARMAALGHARKLAIATPGGAADLRGLLESILEPFDTARFDMVGPAARVPPALMTVLALALHELATNASKYGALSEAEGRVGLRWCRREGRIELEWSESGGPGVCEPKRSGFGTRLIRGALASHGAESELCFTPEGLRCRIAFAEPPPEAGASSAPPGPAPLLPANGASR